MGCCLSTTKRHPEHHKSESKTHQRFLQKTPVLEPDPTHVRDNRSPPPVEEESVKEVLSETPIVSKQQNPVLVQVPVPVPVPVPAEAEAEEEKKTQMLVETKGMINLIPKAEKEVSEASQITESYTLSTTTTATTTTIAEKKEEDEATSKHSREPRVPRKRPYTGELSGRRERASKSPARRAEPSPDKRRTQGRGMGEARTRRLNERTAAGVRRDSGEGSGRRSRSPATRKAGGVGRSPGKGMGRGGGRSVESGLQSQQSSSGVKEEINDSVLKEGNENESLENPHVSLECFIFL